MKSIFLSSNKQSINRVTQISESNDRVTDRYLTVLLASVTRLQQHTKTRPTDWYVCMYVSVMSYGML